MDIEQLTISISVAAEDAIDRIGAIRDQLFTLSEAAAKETKIFVSAANVVETISAMDAVMEKKKELAQPVSVVVNIGDTINHVRQSADALVSYRQSAYQRDVSNHQTALNQKLNGLSVYKNQQIQMVHSQYARQVALIEEATDKEIALYKNKIDALTAMITKSDIDNRDELELRKIAALEDQLKYEKDDANQFHLRQAINKAKDAYDNRKQIEAIQQEIAQYKESIVTARESAAEKITAARAARDGEIQAITAVAKAQEESLKQMESGVVNYTSNVQKAMGDTKVKYNEHGGAVTKIAADTVESTLGEMKKGQTENLSYLMSLAEAYRLAGRNLGQTFSDAFVLTLEQIQSRIDALRREIESLSGSALSYTNGYSGARASSVTNNSLGGITQNFYTEEVTPYQARRMAEDIISSVF